MACFGCPAVLPGVGLGPGNVLLRRDALTGAQLWALPLPAPPVSAFLGSSGADVPLRAAPPPQLGLPPATSGARAPDQALASSACHQCRASCPPLLALVRARLIRLRPLSAC
jgi:hypothetical protein